MKLNEKLIMILTYVLMITMNALANILPINGIGTGAISDSYPNLFAPSGFTFAIWGVIYLLLLVMVIYLITRSKTTLAKMMNNSERQKFVGLFAVSNIANSLWILAWHYRFIAVSVGLMLIILVSLIAMMSILKEVNGPLTQLAFVKPAIGVYFGWITVATVANITTLLVAIGWQGFGIADDIWLMAILTVATGIAYFSIEWSQCPSYGLVILWAYYGILAKHLSPTGFNGRYTGVIMVLAVALVIVLFQTVRTTIKVLRPAMKN